jgi:hypothetical protein
LKATVIKPDFICNKIVPEGTPDLSGTAFNHALGCSATAVSAGFTANGWNGWDGGS